MADWDELGLLDDMIAGDVTDPPSGIYRIRRQEAIPRISGEEPDKKGIVYIGKAADLRQRLRYFRKAAEDGTTPHSGGIRYHTWGYSDLAPLESLVVDWIPVGEPSDLNAAEQAAFLEYREEFKEPPPLNAAQ